MLAATCLHTPVGRLLEFPSLFSGLDKLHNLTTGTPTRYEVRVDLQTANESAYAVYDSFQVASSKERYRLSVGKYRGTAGRKTHLLPARVSGSLCVYGSGGMECCSVEVNCPHGWLRPCSLQEVGGKQKYESNP